MMRQINLREYASSEYSLSVAERDALGVAISSITVEPVISEGEKYNLTPSSTVGAI